jgi:hypothetical protein
VIEAKAPTTLAEVLEAQERPPVGGAVRFWHHPDGDSGGDVTVDIERQNRVAYMVRVRRWVDGGPGWWDLSVGVEFRTWARGWWQAKQRADILAEHLPKKWP